MPTFQYNSSITIQQIFQNILALLSWSSLPESLQYYLPPKTDFASNKAATTAAKLKTTNSKHAL
jgi:hypothetical protein